MGLYERTVPAPTASSADTGTVVTSLITLAGRALPDGEPAARPDVLDVLDVPPLTLITTSVATTAITASTLPPAIGTRLRTSARRAAARCAAIRSRALLCRSRAALLTCSRLPCDASMLPPAHPPARLGRPGPPQVPCWRGRHTTSPPIARLPGWSAGQLWRPAPGGPRRGGRSPAPVRPLRQGCHSPIVPAAGGCTGQPAGQACRRDQQSTSSGRWLRICARAVMKSACARVAAGRNTAARWQFWKASRTP